MKPNLKTICHCVCTYYGVPEEKVQSFSRKQELIIPRRAIILLAYENVDPKLIGQWFQRAFDSLRGTRSEAKKQMEQNEDFKDDINMLRAIISDPEKLFVKKEKVPPQSVLYVPVVKKSLRPPAEYSNRNIHQIHDYYAQIRI